MKSKQTISAMMVFAAIMAVALSPLVLATDEITTQQARPLGIPAVDFQGTTDGWAVISDQAHPAKIVIEGKAIRADDGVWKIRSEAEIVTADRHAILDLKGNAVDGKIKLSGTGTLESGESFRIFLRGHYTPLYGEEGAFILAFTAAKIHFVETGINIPLIQSGIINVEGVNPVVNDYATFLKESTRG